MKKKHLFLSFQTPIHTFRQIGKFLIALKSNVKSLNGDSRKSRASRQLFRWKIKHQILLLTTILIIVVAIMLFVVSQIYVQLFASIMADGFNEILFQENANFQASIMLKYMAITRNYLYNDNQVLKSISQIYNYALLSNYSTDLGVECPRPGKQISYSKIDLFCYVPQATKDLYTFHNSTLNTEFVKFTSVLNSFILCFGFQQSFQMDNVLQINLDNKEEMGSYYPQSSPVYGYLPSQRPFFIGQKSQYQANITKSFYISKYYKWIKGQRSSLYGQIMTQSLTNGTQFQGVIMLNIQFSVFDQILENFPDVNLALVALDGTLLFEQTQLHIYDHYQFIYNQSSTGYNYLDWLNLSSHEDYKKQLIMNNTLFQEPISINIKKFNELPYYFIVYNNLTYEHQIKNIQSKILSQINSNYHTSLFLFILLLVTIIIACYLFIELILQPLNTINKLIYLHHYSVQHFNKLKQRKCSNNIFDILLLIIYFKYSQMQNLSFKKSPQCQMIEDLQLPLKQKIKRERILMDYLLENTWKIQEKFSFDEISSDKVQYLDDSLYTFKIN